MRPRRPIVALAGAALLSVAVAGQASAATKSVSAGPKAKVPDELSINDFFPRTVTVRRGDSVRFEFAGFHNVTIPAKGKKPPAFIAPDAAAKYAGISDAAGKPFWFNGQPRLNLDPRSTYPLGGKSYTGSKTIGSGLPLEEGPPKPYTVKFTKTGTFEYLCTVHGGMKGKVKVVGRGADVPTAAQDRARAAKQLASARKLAAELAKAPVPAGSVSGGSDREHVALLRFFPKQVKIKAGQSVAFSVTSPSEPHTFSFGPEAYLKPLVEGLIAPVPGSGTPPLLAFDGRGLLPSDPPPQPPVYDGTNHGNGFLSTGALGRGLPAQKAAVTFTKPGTYPFICVIHPEMQGSVVVE